MKSQVLLFSLFILIFNSCFVFASGKSQIKTFSDWKLEKVEAAKEQVTQTKTKIKSTQTKYKNGHSSKDPQMVAVRQQLNQHEFNLEVAQDLGVVDYVVLYLAAQKNNKGLKEAAAKMNSEEVAEVLEAYLKAIQTQQFDRNHLQLPRHSTDND